MGDSSLSTTVRAKDRHLLSIRLPRQGIDDILSPFHESYHERLLTFIWDFLLALQSQYDHPGIDFHDILEYKLSEEIAKDEKIFNGFYQQLSVLGDQWNDGGLLFSSNLWILCYRILDDHDVYLRGNPKLHRIDVSSRTFIFYFDE